MQTLGSLKFSGQDSCLGISVELILQPQVLKVCTQNLDQEPHSFLLRSSPDWMKPTHLMKGNPVYSKPTDLNVNHMFNHMTKNTSQQHPDWYLTKQLSTIAKPNWHINFVIIVHPLLTHHKYVPPYTIINIHIKMITWYFFYLKWCNCPAYTENVLFLSHDKGAKPLGDVYSSFWCPVT